MKDPDRPESPGPAGYTDPRDRADSTGIGQFAGIGLQFAAAIILSVYGGQWLDRRLGTSPLWAAWWCSAAGPSMASIAS